MSIDYEKINEGNGWTTQTSLGPTNLNHMESGIKSACDAIDTDCVQATDITPISAYELVSADVSTKAINDGNGNNIANQFASVNSKVDAYNPIITLPIIHYSELPSQSTITETYLKEWLNYVASNYSIEGKIIVAPIWPNGMGYAIGSCLQNKSYAGFTMQLYGSTEIRTFGYANSNWFFREI